jgi:hypothetical protein
VTLEGSWDYAPYLQTYTSGCSSDFSSGDLPQPKVFDPATGRTIDLPAPTPGLGEHVTKRACATTGTPDSMKVVYLVNSEVPPEGLTAGAKFTRAYLFDVTNRQPLKVIDVPDLSDIDKIIGTANGVAALAGSGAKRTAMLSNIDLSVLWTDEKEAVYVGAEAVVMPRNKGIEARSPSGESMWSDPAASYSNSVADGAETLLMLKRDGKVMFFYPKQRGLLDPVVFPPLPGDVNYTITNGHLLVRGERVGIQLWNLNSHQVEFNKTPDDVKKLSLGSSYFFDGHFYLQTTPSGTPNTYAVYVLPNEKPIATQWDTRPVQRMKDWTLVAQGQSEGCVGFSSNSCNIVVHDVNGAFPGPWY